MTKNMRVSDIFNVESCGFELKSKFPDDNASKDRCELYNNRLNSKRFIDAVLEDMTKKSKNTYITTTFWMMFGFDPELGDAIEAELDQIADSKVVFYSFENKPPRVVEVTYRILRNTLTISYHIDYDNPIKDSDAVRKILSGAKPF